MRKQQWNVPLNCIQKLKINLDQIEKIVLTTQESAVRIISKSGPLHNPADRDHCLQYMVAVALLHGDLKADYYEDEFADDPRIDKLREKMHVEEDKQFSKDYLDPDKRSIANAFKFISKMVHTQKKSWLNIPLDIVAVEKKVYLSCMKNSRIISRHIIQNPLQRKC